MSDEFGSDFLTITDDDGNEYELEHLDTVEFGGNIYMAFLPTDLDEDDEEYGMVILRVETEGEEDYLLTVDDEDELDAVFELFLQRLQDEE
jgi:uncharacterized protein YrzB (UPF0473 family)